MSDLIRREDLVKELNAQFAVGDITREIANDILNHIPSAEPERKWIPVAERLPEEKGEYLVSYHPCHWDAVSEKVTVGIDTFRGKTTWAKKKYQKVIAWMPMPVPYEEN